MRTALTISGVTRCFGGDLGAMVEVARIADACGIDEIVLADHVVMGARTDRYPFGTFPYPPGEPWPEPLVVLAAMAATTEHVRLATGILITPLRPAPLLAKQCATLDQLSGGRLDLGVGVGWQREEYEASGLDFARRWRHFDDQIGALAALWGADQPATYESETIAFGPTWCSPRPVQPGGVPLWFGMAASRRTVDRVADHGVGWLPIHTTPREEIARGIERLRGAFATRGRDPATLGVRAACTPVFGGDGHLDVVATRAAAADLERLGVTVAGYGLGRSLAEPAAVRAFVERLGEAFASG